MKIDKQGIMYINALEKIAGVNALDCIAMENGLSFLVKGSEMSRAIGKNGSTIKKIRQRMGKNIDVFEHCTAPKEFIKKAFYNIKTEKIELDSDGKTMKIMVDSENKRKIMNNPGRLKKIREIMKRNYGVENLNIR